MVPFQQAFRTALRIDLLSRNLVLAFLVGGLLTLVNQGKALWSWDQALDHGALVLTFLVPFLVSSFSSVQAIMELRPGSRAPMDLRVRCHECGSEERELKEGELIPECSICKEDTDWKDLKGNEA